MTNQTFPAKTEALPDVLGFVEETLDGYGCPMKVLMSLCVAIEEVFVNIAHYAYGGAEGHVTLGIGFDASDGTITFRFSDIGEEEWTYSFSKETVDGKSVIKIGNNTYVSTELKLE